MAPATRRISIEIPEELADMVAAKVASGEYESESEVIAEGLSYFQSEAQRLEHWLRTEVVAAYDEADSDPDSLISSEEMERRIAQWNEVARSRR